MKNKLIIITGATSGIGLATAELLISKNWQVLLIGRNYKKLKQIKDQFENTNLVFIQQADLSIKKDILKIFQNNEIHWENLYGLVNCAGTYIETNMLTINNKSWEKTFKTNLLAPFLITKLFVKEKLKYNNTQASIVNISSMLAIIGGENPAYAASKAALIGLTKSNALTLSKYSMRVNAICPGAVETAMSKNWSTELRKKIINNTPLGRIAKPAEIANTILWLLSDNSSFITGSVINSTGGQYLGN